MTEEDAGVLGTPAASGTKRKDKHMIAHDMPKDNSLAIPMDMMVDMATEIVRETVKIHGDARIAIEPYTDTVKCLVSERLTYSERKAAGLLAENEQDTVEAFLRDAAKRGEKKRERTNAQTSRKGWKPRRTSNRRLAEDIAHSIRSHAGRTISDYTTDPELVGMVQKALA